MTNCIQVSSRHPRASFADLQYPKAVMRFLKNNKPTKDGQKLFDLYNRRYFRSRLPHYEVLTDGVYRGGRCESWCRRIFVGDSKDFETVLLHEMAHAAVDPNPNHGPVWQKEMIRLRRLGAPVPLKEYKRYANPQAARGKSLIDEILETINLNPKIRCDAIVRSVRRSHGLTKNELIAKVAKALVHVEGTKEFFWMLALVTRAA